MEEVSAANIKKTADYEILPTPVKSENDKKDYRVIRLKNGLTACLISDIKTVENFSETNNANEEKMAGIALSVGVGSLSDPENICGLAHLLEHMIFIESEHENDFCAFTSNSGGYYNAETSREYTVFYFECLKEYFRTGLEKFVHLFESPIIKKEHIIQEREAVNSEFLQSQQLNERRKEQLIISFAKSESPVKFFWGNSVSLKDNISDDELYDKLTEFRERHYSAHRMCLAIQAQLSLDDLQSYVLEYFANLPSNNLPPIDFTKFTDVFDTPQFKKFYYVQPTAEINELELTWAYPSMISKYKSSLLPYFDELFGHEGKGSLFAYFQEKVWVTHLIGGFTTCDNLIYSLFTISMDLTEEGLHHIYEIIEIVYSYIYMVRNLGPQESWNNELKHNSDTNFKFSDESSSVSDYVSSLAGSMQFYPPEHYIIRYLTLFKYDPEDIQWMMDSLVPDKMNVVVICNRLPSALTYNQTEKWFDIKYTEQAISEKWMRKWREPSALEELSLPSPNIFVTDDFNIFDDDRNTSEYPERILKNELLEVWYKKDTKFKVPIAYYGFHFVNPMVLESIKKNVLMIIYKDLMGTLVQQEAYPANRASLAYLFEDYEDGIAIYFGGCNEKLHLLIQLVINHFLNFNENLTEKMFQAVKDNSLNNYYNTLDPQGLASDVKYSILMKNYYSYGELYKAVSAVTFEDVKDFSQDFLNNLFVKSLIQGNVTKDHALILANDIITQVKCKPVAIMKLCKIHFHVTKLPEGEFFCVVKSLRRNDPNSLVTNYYQLGHYSLKHKMILQLLEIIIKNPLFETLRTKEQLSYTVSASTEDIYKILGFSISVLPQATKNTTYYVEKRIENFIKQMYDLLMNMSEEQFQSTKKDLIKKKKCPYVNMRDEFQRNWEEIISGEYIFDRIEQEVAEIESVKLKDVQQWWKEYILDKKGQNFRKLSVQVVGSANLEEINPSQEDKTRKILPEFINNESGDEKYCNHNIITDFIKFKQNLNFYPVASIYIGNNEEKY